MGCRIARLVLVSLALVAAGCVGELELLNAPDPGTPGGADGGGGNVGTAEARFASDVFPAMQARTCTTCHTDNTCAGVGGNACFLGDGQGAAAYTALTGSIYLGATPATSTFATVGNHQALAGGPAFCGGPGVDAQGTADAGCTVDHISAINAWILLQAQ